MFNRPAISRNQSLQLLSLSSAVGGSITKVSSIYELPRTFASIVNILTSRTWEHGHRITSVVLIKWTIRTGLETSESPQETWWSVSIIVKAAKLINISNRLFQSIKLPFCSMTDVEYQMIKCR